LFDTGDRIDKEKETLQGLRAIVSRIGRSRNRMPLSREPYKSIPEEVDRLDPMRFCAMMVAMAQLQKTSRWLAGEEQREECQALWAMASGVREGTIQNSISQDLW
jgi:hypothetical protein